jgi:hypothetical protein
MNCWLWTGPLHVPTILTLHESIKTRRKGNMGQGKRKRGFPYSEHSVLSDNNFHFCLFTHSGFLFVLLPWEFPVVDGKWEEDIDGERSSFWQISQASKNWGKSNSLFVLNSAVCFLFYFFCLWWMEFCNTKPKFLNEFHQNYCTVIQVSR